MNKYIISINGLIYIIWATSLFAATAQVREELGLD